VVRFSPVILNLKFERTTMQSMGKLRLAVGQIELSDCSDLSASGDDSQQKM
jgi:hypothetical protein